MKPILYPSTETEFDTNGIGALSDCVSCTVTEERNGIYELEMEYPITGIHYADIALRRIITAKPNQTSDPQPFRVYEISKPMAGIVTVYAQHIAYDQAGIVVSPFNASSAAGALSALSAHAVTDCPFTYWTDKATVANITVSVPSSIWSLLGGQEGSVLDVYGGEYEFDRYTVKLHSARGYDRGVTIRYGKNLTDLRQDESCAAVYTGVYPYWLSAEGDLVQLPEKIVNASGNYDFTRTLPLDLSSEWEEAPTEDQLRARAETYITANNIGVPQVSLTVSFVQLEQTEEYKGKALLERVSLCDTVHVDFQALGVSATAKCIKTVYNVLLERYDSVGLGDARTSLADIIVGQGQEISKKPSETVMRSAIMALTASILGASGGAVRLLDTNNDGMPDTLYIADNPDPALAVKVWRFNYEGWGASKTGYNGPFVMGATLNDGFVADFMTTGTLIANIVKAGILEDAAGKNYWNMETGEFALSAATTVGGSTVSSIASNAVSDYDSSLGQQAIVDKITNNGTYQGIWLLDGQLFFNGTYIRAGQIDADDVTLGGKMAVYSGTTMGGYVGYMQGSDGVELTDGIGVSDATGECYVIATNAGVRMQAGSTRMYINKNGPAVVDGNLIIKNGTLTYA